eukprot:8870159-Alexandrium_andersonii.AAC.1
MHAEFRTLLLVALAKVRAGGVGRSHARPGLQLRCVRSTCRQRPPGRRDRQLLLQVSGLSACRLELVPAVSCVSAGFAA